MDPRRLLRRHPQRQPPLTRRRRGEPLEKGVDMPACTATPPSRPTITPARLGFDHGWLCLNRTFLNLQLPVLLVDHRLLPDRTPLGLEPFCTRNPRRPLPETAIVAELHPGAMISLWNHSRPGPDELLAWHRVAPGHPSWPAGEATNAVVIMVGDKPPDPAQLGRAVGRP